MFSPATRLPLEEVLFSFRPPITDVVCIFKGTERQVTNIHLYYTAFCETGLTLSADFM